MNPDFPKKYGHFLGISFILILGEVLRTSVSLTSISTDASVFRKNVERMIFFFQISKKPLRIYTVNIYEHMYNTSVVHQLLYEFFFSSQDFPLRRRRSQSPPCQCGAQRLCPRCPDQCCTDRRSRSDQCQRSQSPQTQ